MVWSCHLLSHIFVLTVGNMLMLLIQFVYANLHNLGVYLSAQPLLTQLLQIKEGFIGLTNSPAHPRPTVELLRVWKTDTVDLLQFLSSDKIESCLIYHVSKGALILSMVYDYAKLWHVTAISIVYIKTNIYVGVIHISRKHVMMYMIYYIYIHIYSILCCAFGIEKHDVLHIIL